MSLVYMDTSALLKLLLRETESEQLLFEFNRLIVSGATIVSSALARVELNRARIRNDLGGPHARFDLLQQNIVLDSINLLGITDEVIEAASSITFHVKSLDAIHIATADLIRDDLDSIITYDDNMLRVANGIGLNARRA